MTAAPEPTQEHWEHVPAGPFKTLARKLLPLERRLKLREDLLDRPVVSEVWSALDPSLRYRRVTKADLVIEGPGRSGNTYARYAFEQANQGRWRITSHLHKARPVVYAAKHGIPAIVLIRDPLKVMASTVQYGVTADDAYTLDRYIAFYSQVEPHLDAIVLARFEDVIEDFGAVIRRCNEKYGTSFTPYEKTEANEAAVRRKIIELTNVAVPDRVDQVLGLPSDSRKPADQVRGAMSEAGRERLVEAQALYARVLAASGYSV